MEEAINAKKEAVKQKEAIEAKKPHPGRNFFSITPLKI